MAQENVAKVGVVDAKILAEYLEKVRPEGEAAVVRAMSGVAKLLDWPLGETIEAGQQWMVDEYNHVAVIPNANCPVCRGTGVCVDWVPYGSTNVSMESTCECVVEQLYDYDAEIVLVH